MNIKAAIIDFDGTITNRDMLDLLTEKVGKSKESEELDRQFHEGKLPGLTGLITRINFLQGIRREDIEEMISTNDYLRRGVVELFEYLKNKGIVTIIASGNIILLLEIYQKKLGAGYVVGSHPKMRGNVIESISEEDYSGLGFKARDSKVILDKLGISSEYVVAIGDSPADKGIFEFAAKSIGVNPKLDMNKYIDYSVNDNLIDVIPILENLTNN